MTLRRFLSAPLTVFFLTMFVAAGAHAQRFTGLVIFGDSLSDSSNNAIVIAANSGTPLGTLHTPVPVAGPAFIPDFPYASNQYSNGAVWVTPFATALGLSVKPSLGGGTNFAFGGARSGPGGSGFPFSLLDQMSMFLGATHGVAPPGNLYVVQGGGNDARDAFALAASGHDPAPLISQYVANISHILMTLNAAGARNILLVNVPDIGKTPAIQSFGPRAALLASSLAATMNTALEAAVDELPFAPHTRVFELDAYELVDSIVAKPRKFGLTDATSACAASAACVAAPNGTFFWDGIHPTTAGHAIVARVALKELHIPQRCGESHRGYLRWDRDRAACSRQDRD
jgi:phospholipase/lecithinase/hemolysin